LVIELPERADDSYQGTTATIRVNFQAVQQNGNVADSKHLSIDDADKTGTILDAEGLEILSKNVAAGTQYKDYTLSLASDLDMSYANWTPIGSADATTYNFKGTLDGGGHTLSHLLILEPNSNYVGLFRNLMSGSVKNLILSDEYVSGTQSVGGLAGEVFPGAESISNVQSLNSTILGNHWVGGLVGYAYSASVSDCTVSGTTIDCVPNLVSGAYDNGDKAGGLIGANNDYAKVEGNSVKNCTITAYRDVGGLVGLQSCDQTVIAATYGANSVTGTSITSNQSLNWYEDKTANVGAFVGRDNTATPSVLDVSACTGSGNTLKKIAHDGTVTTL
jgi:hypothetical protein